MWQIPVASLLIEVRSPWKVIKEMFHPVDKVFIFRRSSFPVLASFVTSPWAKCSRRSAGALVSNNVREYGQNEWIGSSGISYSFKFPADTLKIPVQSPL